VQFRTREFRREDFDTLWGIDKECFPPEISYSRLELGTYIRRPQSFTLVAESTAPTSLQSKALQRNAGIVGFIVAESSVRHVGHIITIDVVPEARRLSVGSKLLSDAEIRLRASGCRGVLLETAVDNAPAHEFYKRHGYFLRKTIPRYYSNGVDAFVMQKDLLPETSPGQPVTGTN
jgi:ribosomal protein S18 acetylase RimI-like enzyme